MKGPRGRGTATTDKPPIFGMIERGGQMVLRVLENVQQATIQPIIEMFIKPGTLVNTDEYNIYGRLTEWGYEHKTVCHATGEYARDEDGENCYGTRYMRIRWRAFGRYYGVGCVPIGAFRRKDCRFMSAFSSLYTMSEDAEKHCCRL